MKPVSISARDWPHALLGLAAVLAAGVLALTPRTSTAQGAPGDQVTEAETPADSQDRARDRRRADRDGADTGAAEGAPVAAPPAQADAASAAPTVVVADPQVVCKNMKITGSRMAKRVCATPEQWEAAMAPRTAAAQETMRQMRDSTTIVVRSPTSATNPSGALP